MLQIVILAVVALFLFWRLRSVLGTRDGFEKTMNTIQNQAENPESVNNISKSEKALDNDITDYVDEESDSAKTLLLIKDKYKEFTVEGFVSGAKQAYEIILMAFENNDLRTLKPLLEKPVYESFRKVLKERDDKNISIDASFVGMRDIRIENVFFDKKNSRADIAVTFKCELTTVAKDSTGKILEGDPSHIKKQKDTWTFSKILSDKKPIWYLKST
jgi:predicted lipid-binding transport protein (Tim44 family)